MALAFTVGSGLAGPISECIGRRVLMSVAAFLIVAAMLLIGSSSLPLTWIGLALNGLAVSGIFIPIIPEIMFGTELNLKKTETNKPDRNDVEDRFLLNQSLAGAATLGVEPLNTVSSDSEKEFNEVKLDKNEGEQSNLSDKAAAVNAISFSIGSVIGPPLGGGLYDHLTWNDTLLVMSFIALIGCVTFVIISSLTIQKK
jgi:MFS family permease